MIDFAEDNGEPGRAVAPAAANHPLRFYFEGTALTAAAGQTIAAALYAHGLRIFSRSFKYHRPRGLFCVSGQCPNCMMEVDGTPNVRTCTEPARDGAVVRRQNAWPDAESDVLAVADRLDAFLPVGFYYKRMYRPRWAWPIYETVLRNVAGLGHIDPHSTAPEEYITEHLHADVTVVGAGPAGISAALQAAQAGARVVLLERHPTPGGHLLYEPFRSASMPECGEGSAQQIAARLNDLLLASGQIEFFPAATAFGVYEGRLVAAVQGRRMLRIRTRHLLVATGSDDRPLVFHKNDLPGVLLGRGALRLLNLYGVAPGKRVLIVTSGSEGIALAGQLRQAGVTLAGIVDLNENTGAGGDLGDTPLLASHAIVAAVGRRQVRAAVLTAVDEHGQPVPGSKKQIACDTICISAGRLPRDALLRQAGCRMAYDQSLGCYIPAEYAEDVSAAGEVTGIGDPGAILLQGRLRGAEAALRLGLGADRLREHCRRMQEELQQHTTGTTAVPPRLSGSLMPSLSGRARKRFVCLCEDVTDKDLHQAIDEGYDNIETLKRYSTVCMGPCQGIVCSMSSTEVCAQHTLQSPGEVGITTARPPVEPVALGVLARKYSSPARQTPLASRHRRAGVVWMDTGSWKRPESYGDASAEYRAVRHRVGLIDVSTLGKIELFGPDAAKLLERVYLNRWAKLAVGRVRYGVMCTEEGMILDDGTCCRLGDDQYFMTTTSGNAAFIFSWLKWWRETWGLDVEVVDATCNFAALSVAGPNSRDVLSSLTDADLRTAAAPYMSVTAAQIAGVATRTLRIGFVGELGYEIHVASQYAEYLWDELLRAGESYRMRPVGVEAQRRLRLDKGHVIVGQDTDALSHPLAADMEWIVKFDKPRFVGRSSLRRYKDELSSAERLVGFVVDHSGALLVPLEGAVVVAGDRPVGRVTSARFSEACGRIVGMAWVQHHLCTAGSVLEIPNEGGQVTGRVVRGAFYDPQGRQLNS